MAFRTDPRDAMPKPSRTKTAKPGAVPPGRLGVFDSQGRMRGHVGKMATQATCVRFGVNDAQLSTKDGRACWRGKGASK
jgi:hypothetical protein